MEENLFHPYMQTNESAAAPAMASQQAWSDYNIDWTGQATKIKTDDNTMPPPPPEQEEAMDTTPATYDQQLPHGYEHQPVVFDQQGYMHQVLPFPMQQFVACQEPPAVVSNAKKKCCACQCKTNHGCFSVGATQVPLQNAQPGRFCILNRKSYAKDYNLRLFLGHKLHLKDASHMRTVMVKKGALDEKDLRKTVTKIVVNVNGSSEDVERWITKKGCTVDWPEEQVYPGQCASKDMQIATALLNEKVYKKQFKSDMTICSCHFDVGEIEKTKAGFKPIIPPSFGLSAST
eukprot:m.132519 g.132519  ORF g.132519 m.132519 type:complete len:289 (+) comp14648_c0_seq1:283-1149(+)